jgi:hypothetical protein
MITNVRSRLLIIVVMLAVAALITWAISIVMGSLATLSEINEPNPESVPLHNATRLLDKMNVPGSVRKIIYYNADHQDVICVLDGDVDKDAFAGAMDKSGYTATLSPSRFVEYCWTKGRGNDSRFVLLSHRGDWIVGVITQPAPSDPTRGPLARLLKHWPVSGL